jgi:hypothetical protein
MAHGSVVEKRFGAFGHGLEFVALSFDQTADVCLSPLEKSRKILCKVWGKVDLVSRKGAQIVQHKVRDRTDATDPKVQVFLGLQLIKKHVAIVIEWRLAGDPNVVVQLVDLLLDSMAWSWSKM